MILEFANFQHLHFYGFDIYSCPEIEYKLLFINIFDPTVNLVITHSTILQKFSYWRWKERNYMWMLTTCLPRSNWALKMCLQRNMTFTHISQNHTNYAAATFKSAQDRTVPLRGDCPHVPIMGISRGGQLEVVIWL